MLNAVKYITNITNIAHELIAKGVRPGKDNIPKIYCQSVASYRQDWSTIACYQVIVLCNSSQMCQIQFENCLKKRTCTQEFPLYSKQSFQATLYCNIRYCVVNRSVTISCGASKSGLWEVLLQKRKIIIPTASMDLLMSL